MFTLGALYFTNTVIILVAIFIAPTIIAFVRKHKNTIPIALVNIFFGLTFIGYIFALIWSFTSNCKPDKKIQDWKIITAFICAIAFLAVSSWLFFSYYTNQTEQRNIIEIKEYRSLQ